MIASGGLWDGVDVAKCLALGAAAAGLARPFLLAAQADRAGAAVGAVLDAAAHRDLGRRRPGGRARWDRSTCDEGVGASAPGSAASRPRCASRAWAGR